MTDPIIPRISPPVAPRRPHAFTTHGMTVTDDYAWLKDENWQEVLRDPAVLNADIRRHLEAENDYTESLLGHTEPLQKKLVAEMRGRIKEDDFSVPAPDGPFAYLRKFREGGQHEQYLRLLNFAGCEYGDLRAGVLQDGLEATLRDLAAKGVYFTDSEFRGLSDTVRSGGSFRVAPEDFRPRASPVFSGVPSSTSGTTARVVSSFISLPWLEKEALAGGIFFDAHNLLEHRHAILDALRPGTGGMSDMMILAKFGVPVERWFARRPLGSRLSHVRDEVLAYELSVTGRLLGPGFAKPMIVESDDLSPIVKWVASAARAGQRTAIRTVASGAARIARTALDSSTPLDGLVFLASGEPMTEAKQEIIQASRAAFTVLYGFDPGTVHVGFGCADREHPDEMHVSEHTLAVIEQPRATYVAGQEIRPLLYTTLYSMPTAIRLNLESGDYATMTRRQCGCRLGEAGLTLHVHHVASHEKFTSEGLNYNYRPLFEFIEAVLPSEFGGIIGDYQLLEEEDESGTTRLTLLIHPRLGHVDEAEIRRLLIKELQKGSTQNREVARRWDAAGTVRTKRAAPLESERGKILPLRRRK